MCCIIFAVDVTWLLYSKFTKEKYHAVKESTFNWLKYRKNAIKQQFKQKTTTCGYNIKTYLQELPYQ